MGATLSSSWPCDYPPVRNYYVVCFVVSGVKTFISPLLQQLQDVSFSKRRDFVALTRGNNDDDEQDDDADNQAHAHLHVLPPHLLAYTVGAPPEALCGDSKVVGLILQRVEAGTALRDLVDVVAHDTDRAVDFLVSWSATAYGYGAESAEQYMERSRHEKKLVLQLVGPQQGCLDCPVGLRAGSGCRAGVKVASTFAATPRLQPSPVLSLYERRKSALHFRE